MAYKQSPFPMIEGTSPVKSLGLVKHLIKYGIKGGKAVKKAFSKSPFGPPKGKQILPKSKSAHVKGTVQKEKLSPNSLMWPGKMSTQHPNFMKWASGQSKESAKYWYNPLKK